MKPTRTQDNYLSHWRKIVTHWGDRRIYGPSPSEISGLANTIRAERTIRRSDRGGHSVQRAVLDALRCLYRHAVADGLISPDSNPASAIERAPQRRSTRRGLPEPLLADIHRVLSAGPDPDLHCLLSRLHSV